MPLTIYSFYFCFPLRQLMEYKSWPRPKAVDITLGYSSCLKTFQDVDEHREFVLKYSVLWSLLPIRSHPQNWSAWKCALGSQWQDPPFLSPLSQLLLPYFTKEWHHSFPAQILLKCNTQGGCKTFKTIKKKQWTGETECVNTSFCKSGGFQLLISNKVEREPNRSCQLIDH